MKQNMKQNTDKWWLEAGYQEAKDMISTNVNAISWSFIVIGYYLKHIRNKELYREEGYQDIWEFAEQNYGIKKSTASRWMSMNDRFSKDGNSPILLEEYKDYSKSQLQEMLYLETDKLEEITPDMTAKEIRQAAKPKREELEQVEPPKTCLYDEKESCIACPGEPCCDFCEESGNCNTECGWQEERIPRMKKEAVAPAQQKTIKKCREDKAYECSIEETIKRYFLKGGNITGCAGCCDVCRNMSTCEHICEYAKQKLEADKEEEAEKELEPGKGAVDAEYREAEKEDDEYYYSPAYFLAEQKGTLEEWLAVGDLPEKMLQRQKSIVAGLEALVDKNEEIDSYDPDRQPELPILKNMEQREAFVNSYKDWPVWSKNECTEETYYRYNLPDRSAIVVRHYPSYESWIQEEYEGRNLYLLKPDYKHFKNCETSMTCLREYMKEVQKGE